MRVFAALEVTGAVADSRVAFQKELLASGADIKFVERENLHLNLKFLGEISEGDAAAANSRLERISAVAADVDVRGAGAFPSPVRPRVAWAGIAQEQEEPVISVAREVIGLLDGIGERDDRPFRPHITLGRVRSFRNIGQLAGVLKAKSGREFGRMGLREVKLKSSVLAPGGPVYRDIGVYSLH